MGRRLRDAQAESVHDEFRRPLTFHTDGLWRRSDADPRDRRQGARFATMAFGRLPRRAQTTLNGGAGGT